MKEMTKILSFFRTRQTRKLVLACVLGILLGLLGGSTALWYYQPSTSLFEEGETIASSTAVFARSAPVYIRIPSVNLEAEFEAPLGLNEDNTIEVPDTYTKVAWYEYGATPGEVGTASVLGHVDSYEGPAVFWPLRHLEEGDLIEIDRADGTTAIFEVTDAKMYNQDNFPTEEVYAHTEYPSLRLITCTGTYDRGTQRYSHNLVVYAKLKEEPESSPTL